jgi:hypothetical protein
MAAAEVNSPAAPPGISICRQDFGARAKEPHHLIPARHGRQAIRNLAVTAAELNSHGAVRVFPGRDFVQRIGVVLVWLQRALGRCRL